MTNKFPQRLKEARESKRLRQIDVQKQIGVNNRTLSGYENGISEPDYSTLISLSNLYDVSVDWLLGRTNESSICGLINPSIELSELSAEVFVNGRLLTDDEKNKISALALIIFG